jgi:hypothetical protein
MSYTEPRENLFDEVSAIHCLIWLYASERGRRPCLPPMGDLTNEPSFAYDNGAATFIPSIYISVDLKANFGLIICVLQEKIS